MNAAPAVVGVQMSKSTAKRAVYVGELGDRGVYV